MIQGGPKVPWHQNLPTAFDKNPHLNEVSTNVETLSGDFPTQKYFFLDDVDGVFCLSHTYLNR